MLTGSAPRTHRDAGAEAGAGLRAGGADVVAHGRVLVAGSVQVSHRAWTVGAGETAGSGRVGAYTQTQQGEGGWGGLGTAAQRRTAKNFSQGKVGNVERTHDWIQTQTTEIGPSGLLS